MTAETASAARDAVEELKFEPGLKTGSAVIE
jgi:hypothetical protein